MELICKTKTIQSARLRIVGKTAFSLCITNKLVLNFLSKADVRSNKCPHTVNYLFVFFIKLKNIDFECDYIYVDM